jgi:hypothetical protein
MLRYIFGEGTETPDAQALARKRQIADQLTARSVANTPRNLGEGLTAIGQAIAGRIKDRRLQPKEQAERDRIAAMLSGGGFGMGAGGMPGGPPVSGATVPPVSSRPVDPNAPQNIASDTMAALGKDPASTIREGLVSRGLAPHVADAFILNFKDESGLRTDINEIAPIVPGSRGGYGLAQWTGPRRRALEAYAQERGAPVSDMNVQLDFLMQELQGPESRAAQNIMAAPDTGTAAAAIVRDFLRPLPQHQQSRAARYTGGQGGGQPQGGNMSAQMLAEIMGNPYASEGQKMVAQAIMQQQMQANDPMRQLQMQQLQMQIEQMGRPQQPDPTSGMREYEFARTQGYEGSFADWKRGNVPSTNVNVSTGTVPPGYQQITDPETGAIRMEPIPGGPAERQIQEDARGAQVGQDNLRRTGGAAIQDVGRALELLGVDRTVPIAGGISRLRAAIGPFVGDYDARNLRQLIDSAKSSVSINEIMKMREAGGTLGAIPYQQQQSFERMLGELDADGDPAMLEQNFKRLHNLFWEMVDPEGTVRPDPFALPFDESGFSTGNARPQPPPQMEAPTQAPRAVNPTTGETVEWNGSQWVPVQ